MGPGHGPRVPGASERHEMHAPRLGVPSHWHPDAGLHRPDAVLHALLPLEHVKQQQHHVFQPLLHPLEVVLSLSQHLLVPLQLAPHARGLLPGLVHPPLQLAHALQHPPVVLEQLVHLALELPHPVAQLAQMVTMDPVPATPAMPKRNHATLLQGN